MRAIAYITTGIALVSALSVHAGSTYDVCLRTAKGVRQVQHCTALEIKYQNDALNREFQSLLAARPTDRERLISAQDAWKTQADATCTVFSRRQGSLNSMKAQDCFRDEMIKRRIAIKADEK